MLLKKMQMSKLKMQLPIWIAILSFCVSYGQITGKIVDASNQNPLEYATAALYKKQDKI